MTQASKAVQQIVMRQRWRDLLFLHWPIPAAEIRRTLPPGLIVDQFRGTAYVGLVPFLMRDVTPSWFAPVPLVSDLLECNVRTYVRREDGSAPGVWFYSLDANGPVAVAVARALFALPYFFASMRQSEQRVWHDDDQKAGGWARQVTYQSERHHPGVLRGNCHIAYETSGGAAEPSAHGSLNEFLLERYTLYSYRDQQLYAGQVHHRPYIIQCPRLLAFDESLLSAAGFERPSNTPLVHYSREVVVEVSPLVAVAPRQ